MCYLIVFDYRMEKLINFCNKRMDELNLSSLKNFRSSKEMVYQKEGRFFIHTFNYLLQEKYLELDEICNNFNKVFQ